MTESQFQLLKVRIIDDVTVVQFKQTRLIDENTVRLLRPELDCVADNLRTQKLLINFGDVEFVSSAVLGYLVQFQRKVASKGGQIQLANVSRAIVEIFRLTKLQQLFQIKQKAKESQDDDDDDDDNLGGVTARVPPRNPPGRGSVSLPIPPPEEAE